ncbi:hypothetical protein KIPB_007174 [Kipferlia bialata]|uniref:Uncharacterized protein n=1 Tax=Kipferlia bialata TaxID=797122 RepID=A0A9K3GIV4_9EUKA|nr:hypothetical protein KIPB_007174 [Kipferlia bialata]|eukprot:g7174.t1
MCDPQPDAPDGGEYGAPINYGLSAPTYKELTRKQQRRIARSFTEADVKMYAAVTMAIGIAAYSQGPKKVFSLNQRERERIEDLMARGSEVPGRCHQDQRLLSTLKRLTIRNGWISEETWGDLQRNITSTARDGIPPPTPEEESLDDVTRVYQQVYKDIIPVLRSFYERSFHKTES